MEYKMGCIWMGQWVVRMTAMTIISQENNPHRTITSRTTTPMTTTPRKITPPSDNHPRTTTPDNYPLDNYHPDTHPPQTVLLLERTHAFTVWHSVIRKVTMWTQCENTAHTVYMVFSHCGHDQNVKNHILFTLGKSISQCECTLSQHEKDSTVWPCWVKYIRVW